MHQSPKLKTVGFVVKYKMDNFRLEEMRRGQKTKNQQALSKFKLVTNLVTI